MLCFVGIVYLFISETRSYCGVQVDLEFTEIVLHLPPHTRITGMLHYGGPSLLPRMNRDSIWEMEIMSYMLFINTGEEKAWQHSIFLYHSIVFLPVPSLPFISLSYRVYCFGHWQYKVDFQNQKQIVPHFWFWVLLIASGESVRYRVIGTFREKAPRGQSLKRKHTYRKY